MKIKTSRICPICDSPLADVLFSQKFVVSDGFPLSNTNAELVNKDVVSCSACGFCYTDDTLSQCDYDAYYEKYAKYSHAAFQTVDLTINDFDSYLIDMVCKSCNSAPRKKTIDIGCGAGKLLIGLKSRGFTDLSGVDISNATEDFLKLHDIQYRVGSVTDKDICCRYDRKFDVACIISVLEHVFDIRSALLNLRNMLEKDGVVLISVPDASCYAKELSNPLMQINLEHINHFDRDSLDNLMAMFGFIPYLSEKYVVSTQKLESTQLITVYKKVTFKSISAQIKISEEASTSIIEMAKKWYGRPEDELLNQLAQNQTEITVFGAGNYTFNLLADTKLRDCNIVAYVDGNPYKQGEFIDGVPIYSHQYLSGFSGLIMVCVAYEPDSIIKKLRDMGLENRIHAL